MVQVTYLQYDRGIATCSCEMTGVINGGIGPKSWKNHIIETKRKDAGESVTGQGRNGEII